MAAKWYCSRYSNNCVRGFDRALLEAVEKVSIIQCDDNKNMLNIMGKTRRFVIILIDEWKVFAWISFK